MTNHTLGGTRPWRLGARTRKGVLVVHIVSAGVWIGIDVVMAVVIFRALLADNDEHQGALLPGARTVRGLAAAHGRLGLSSQRRWSGARHQVRPGAVLVGGNQADVEHCAHRTGSDRVATGGEQGGRAGLAVRSWRTSLARGGQPDLSANRFPDCPAHRGGVGSVQAVGSNS